MISTISAEHYLVLAGLLFSIGLFGILLRRNILIILLCLELMLNAANLALITASSVHGQADGQILAFFVMVIAAVEVTIGLAIAVLLFKEKNSVDTKEMTALHG